MSNKKLIRKSTITVNEGEVQERFILEYYVLEREAFVDGTSANTYGIEVLKRSSPNSKTLKVEYRKIFDIFCTEAEAVEAAFILAENTVTPISVCDIIEQFIGTDEFECEEYEIAAV